MGLSVRSLARGLNQTVASLLSLVHDGDPVARLLVGEDVEVVTDAVAGWLWCRFL